MKTETFDYVFLKNLMNTSSPSGYEEEAVACFEQYCKSLGATHEFTDNMLNSCFSIGTGEKKIMISAHIDELGFQVQRITENGMIQFISLGGIDKKVLPGISVYFPNLGIKGVIGKKPIHLEERNDKESIDIKDLLVDVGAENKEEVNELGINIGDIFLPDTNGLTNLGKNRFTDKGLDDKIGVFIITQVLKELIKDSNLKKKIKLFVLATSQEEFGLRGAIVSSKRINPDISIDIDVTFATDEGRDICLAEEGDIFLGKGPVINYGPDKNNYLNKVLIDTADSFKIKYQRVCSGPGGTNTSVIQENCFNCSTTHLSIPLRNMHTPVEVCDYRDVEKAIELLTLSIYNLV